MIPTPFSGTTVEIVAANMPHLRGRTGVVERPEVDGCYVRFPGGAYVYCFWEEIEEQTT